MTTTTLCSSKILKFSFLKLYQKAEVRQQLAYWESWCRAQEKGGSCCFDFNGIKPQLGLWLLLLPPAFLQLLPVQEKEGVCYRAQLLREKESNNNGRWMLQPCG